MPQSTISADEINLLVYSYLQDSGFTHSAFSFSSEAQLSRSPYFNKHIERGALIELLVKSLHYLEVEAHFRGSISNEECKAPFSLLDPHRCSLDPPPPPTASQVLIRHQEQRAQLASKPTRPNGSTTVESVLAVQGASTSESATVQTTSTKDPNAMDVDQRGPQLSSHQNARHPAEPDATVIKADKSQAPTANPRSVPASLSSKGVLNLIPGHESEVKFFTDLNHLSFTGHVFVASWHPKTLNLLATGTKDGRLKLWDIPEAIDLQTPPISISLHSRVNHQCDVTSIAWSKDGTFLAVGAYDGVFRVYQKDGVLWWSSSHHTGPIFTVKFSLQGASVLTASLDGTACLWSLEQRKVVHQFKAQTRKDDCCLDVEWLDDETFVSCGSDQKAHIIKLDPPVIIKTLSGHEDEVNMVRCNPQRTRLATCSDDGTARIWNIEKHALSSDDQQASGAVVLKGHRHSISGLRWQPTPTMQGAHPRVVTSSFDGTVRIWDSVTGDSIKVISDHKRPIYSLTWSLDGRFVASGSGDGCLHIYSMKTLKKIWTWVSDIEKPGIFEAEWQTDDAGRLRWIALALESSKCVVIDVTKIPELQSS